MNAKEYFNSVKDTLTPDVTIGEAKKVAQDLFMNFAKETKLIYDYRKASTTKAFAAIVNEQNQKWNSLKNILDREGYNILKRNGFKEALVLMAKGDSNNA